MELGNYHGLHSETDWDRFIDGLTTGQMISLLKQLRNAIETLDKPTDI